MNSLGRVVWREGMHLSQHHFQAHNRYVEELVRFVASNLGPEAFGLAGYEFDAEALQNDTVSLIHARGIMPDGLAFQFPDDPLPEPRQIRDLFSPTQDSHLVLLCIPPFLDGRANVASEGTSAARFVESTRPVVDEAGGVDTRPVPVARKNFRLLLDVEDTSRSVSLPVARVRRDGSGHFIYDDSFIAPSLRLGASASLVTLVERLLETLSARSAALSTEVPADDGAVVANHWLAHTIHASLGTLSHMHRLRHAHPSDLFAEMSRLAGALCTFSMHAHPRDLPAYDHLRPGESFGELERRIRELLNVVAPSNTVRIPLRPVGEAFYAATVTDPRCLGSAEWFLSVRSPIGPAEVAGRVPRLVNICSAKHIGRLVREAIPGLVPSHLISPPSAIAPRPGTEYFAIPRTGPCWASIVETREVGVYVPAAIADAEIEIVVAVGD